MQPRTLAAALIALALLASTSTAIADDAARTVRAPLRLHLDVPPLDAPDVDPAALAESGGNMLAAGVALSIAGDLLVAVAGVAWANARPDHPSCGGGGGGADGWDISVPNEWPAAWGGSDVVCHTVHDPANDVAPVVLGAGVLTAGAGLALVIAGATVNARARRLEDGAMRATPYVAPTGGGMEAGLRIEGL